MLTRPRHPYTQGLVGATPTTSVDSDAQKRLNQIPGAMPGLLSIPGGCAFHPRCTSAIASCSEKVPPLVHDESGSIACILVSGEQS